LEPQRCPHRAVAAAAQGKPQPVPTRQQLQVPVPTANGQRLLQVPIDPNAAGRQPSREPLALDVRPRFKPVADEAPLPSGAPSREDLRALLTRILEPSQAKNFEGLKPFITQRLYDSLSPLLVNDGGRLWRHLSKYPVALTSGFTTDVLSQEGGKVQLHLSLSDGSELRPILEKQNGLWKIDRF
jgi:hypothetical protein